jgi:hypothetical protein
VSWFLVILFMEWEQYPVYLFTEPQFSSYEECIISSRDPEDVQGYVKKLLEVYGRPMPVKGVVCIDENMKDRLLKELSI